MALKAAEELKEIKFEIAGQEIKMLDGYIKCDKKSKFRKYVAVFGKKLFLNYFDRSKSAHCVIEGTKLQYMIMNKNREEYYNPVLAIMWLTFDFSREAGEELGRKVMPFIGLEDRNIFRCLVAMYATIFILPEEPKAQKGPGVFASTNIKDGSYLVIERVSAEQYQMTIEQKVERDIMFMYKLPIEQYNIFVESWLHYFDQGSKLVYDELEITLAQGYSHDDFALDLAKFANMPAIKALR
jgi:hypothetical protein